MTAFGNIPAFHRMELERPERVDLTRSEAASGTVGHGASVAFSQ
jgi:hypothetical protein